MEDDTGPSRSIRLIVVLFIVVVCSAWAAFGTASFAPTTTQFTQGVVATSSEVPIFSNSVLILLACLIVLSAFFSASEVAFFILHQVRLRVLQEEGGMTGRLVASMMQHPGRLLTTILVGNMIVNVLIGVLLPIRIERALERAANLPPWIASVLTVLIAAGFLVFLGEITPKALVARIAEPFARVAAIPLKGIDAVLGPVCRGLILFTNFVFRVTRFDDIKAAPFITDEEFKNLLTNSEAQGVLEQDEGQMIQGILEFSDALLREILVPRPDVVAIGEEATVAEALELFREKEFSRVPIFRDNLDRVTGVLFAKDLLPSATKGEMTRPVKELRRAAHFVPETMTVHGFVKDAQRTRNHLAIVVDEYGGTEGIVTLEDAIEEVVGDIHDPSSEEKTTVQRLGHGSYIVDGNLPLDELNELIGVELDEMEHETLAGLLMELTNKIPERGDRVEFSGAVFTVKEVDGKRASSIQIEAPGTATQETQS